MHANVDACNRKLTFEEKKKTAVATGTETASVLCLSYPTVMGGGRGGGEWREGKGEFFGGPGWVG